MPIWILLSAVETLDTGIMVHSDAQDIDLIVVMGKGTITNLIATIKGEKTTIMINNVSYKRIKT